MKVKEHYDHHLGYFYSWMSGDFTEKQAGQQQFFATYNITPFANKIAIDLGCGHGLQSVSLANLGFQVKAVDFNAHLLNELHERKGNQSIEIIESEIIHYLSHFNDTAAVIVCMGDTLTHLENRADVITLLQLTHQKLVSGGKLILSFRDLTAELKQEERFIPVKSDENRIFTCFLEYFPHHVMVHDLLHIRENGTWVQKVSSYPKLRLSGQEVVDLLMQQGFVGQTNETINRMIHLIAQKVNP